MGVVALCQFQQHVSYLLCVFDNKYASACIVACYGVNIFTKNENILHYLNSFGFRKENVVHVFRHTTSGRPFFYVRIIFRNALN